MKEVVTLGKWGEEAAANDWLGVWCKELLTFCKPQYFKSLNK